MTHAQQQLLNELLAFLVDRQGRSNVRTASLLKECYHLEVAPRRVTWNGGVGSWKVMRSRRVRLQVCASVSAFAEARTYTRATPSGNLIVTRSKPVRGWKYAPCVEF